MNKKIILLVSLSFLLVGCSSSIKGIDHTYINDNGELIVVYSDNSEDNLGVVKDNSSKEEDKEEDSSKVTPELVTYNYDYNYEEYPNVYHCKGTIKFYVDVYYTGYQFKEFKESDTFTDYALTFHKIKFVKGNNNDYFVYDEFVSGIAYSAKEYGVNYIESGEILDDDSYDFTSQESGNLFLDGLHAKLSDDGKTIYLPSIDDGYCYADVALLKAEI